MCVVLRRAAFVTTILLYLAIALHAFTVNSDIDKYLHLKRPCKVHLFAETDVSETNFLFESLLSQVHKCGCDLDWHRREDYVTMYEGVQEMAGPLILVATGGPNRQEQLSFLNISKAHEILLIHPSDEGLSQTNISIYGNVKLSVRNYFHSGMDVGTVDYLLADKMKAKRSAKHLWMPLGLANLKKLPKALRRDLLARQHLWSWVGSTGSKPERAEMLEALHNHPSIAHVLQLGTLQAFNSYAGRPIGSQDSMNVWEYTILLQDTQFLPLPAGISAEQFRIWEAFEAGDVRESHSCMSLHGTFCPLGCCNLCKKMIA